MRDYHYTKHFDNLKETGCVDLKKNLAFKCKFAKLLTFGLISFHLSLVNQDIFEIYSEVFQL